MEKRRNPRVARTDSAHFGLYPSATTVGCFVDLSAGGALIRCSLNPQLYSLIRCRLLHQMRSRMILLDLSGTVVRCVSDGFALEWDAASSARVYVQLLSSASQC